MYIAIIFITLTFGLIFFNVINNKKISILSTFFLIILLSYYVCYMMQNEFYYKLSQLTNNINLYYKIFCILTMLVSFLEYYISYKSKIRKESIKEEISSNLNEVDESKTDDINDLLIYIELFDEPIGYLINNNFILNTKMKKIIKYDDNTISGNEFYNNINHNDKSKFSEKNKTNIFRFKSNNEKWFEIINVSVKDKDYKLVRQTDNNRINQKINLKAYKELNSDVKSNYKDNKEFYLVFISINNIRDIISFYGKDFSDLVINKYLLDVYNLPFIFQIKIYYISKTEYVILLEDRLEYNSLLSELEDNISIITRDDISISDTIITVKSKVGIIKSESVNDAYTLINKGYDMMQLASSEYYPNDFVIYHEIDEDIDFNYDNIDINLDLNNYKQRLQ